MTLATLAIEKHVATITMERGEKRNALSKALISDLIDAAHEADQNDVVRVIVLQGAGKLFCAGADIEWMKNSLHASEAENRADAAMIAKLMATFAELRKPVVARVHGAAIGGGVGLVATADIAIAADDTIFSLSEVRLGVIPSVIAPYVVPRIGGNHAHRYFITGERMDAATAQTIGLVHEVVPTTQLDDKVAELCNQIVTGGPNAVIAAKQMVRDLVGTVSQETTTATINKLAAIRITPEAQEGMSAFFEKRKPTWMID